MHVLLIPSFYPNVANSTHGIFCRDQAKALIERGLTVGVLYCGEKAPWQVPRLSRLWRPRIEQFDDEGIATVQEYRRRWWPGYHWPRLRAWTRAGLRLFDHYVAGYGRPDLVHAHTADPAGLLAARIKEAHGIPYVLTEHASWLVLGSRGETNAAVADVAIRNANAAIAVSPDLAERLAARFTMPTGGWRCIPNTVDREFLKLPLRERDEKGTVPFTFLYVAHLIPLKGHAELLRAFAEAFRGDDSVSMRFVGDGPSRAALERLAKELGIASRTEFLGRLPRADVVREVARCDAIAAPSNFETFGVMLIEGMAAGKPVVTTRCGGPEWIVNEESGILVDIGDVRRLAEALARMRREIEHYDAAAIRRDVEHRYSPQAIADALAHVYEDVLST